MKAFLLGLGLFTLLSQGALASVTHPVSQDIVPQPTACIAAEFSSTGSNYWKSIVLKLKNNCGKAVNFQNATVSFQSGVELNVGFWGDFTPLSYPDNELKITSQRQSAGNFLATFNLHFPSYSGTNSILPAGSAIFIKYGAVSEAHVEGTTQVYLGDTVATGNIELTNASSKPTNILQNYALIHLTTNGQKVSDIQLPWSGTQTVSGLAAGSYTILADSITESGNSYQGSATPALINLTAGQTAKTTITYILVQQVGKVAVQLQALPSQLAGYTGKPTVSLTQSGTGSSMPITLSWGASSIASQLKNGSTYSFSTPTISYNGFQCTPTFTPPTLIASATSVPLTSLTYSCNQVAQNVHTFNVKGAPSTLSSLRVTLTPNNNTAAVIQTIALNNGTGSSTVSLTNGAIYTVSSDAVAGYSISFNPQPFTSVTNATETITLTPQATGTPVSINGQLKVCGTQLCNEQGQPIQLRGMSTHGLQWYGLNSGHNCLTSASLDTLARDFGASVIRVSMYVQEGGYESNPTKFTAEVNTLIAEASKRGIYVIVDWHQLTPGDPNYNLTRAQKFFTDIATANKGKNNLLYEIANEPNGVSWSTIKSYADKIIPVIRAIDSKTIILVGTHAWGSLGISDGRTSQDIINQPVNFPNIMYTFHFYAASHKDQYLNELDKASNVLPMFVTEWGSQTASGDGNNDFVMSEKYLQLLAKKKISWTNWNYSDDFRSGAVWKSGTCSAGPWTDNNLKPAGVWVKAKIKG